MNPLEYINGLIGIPYIHGGRDPKTGLDCYGLCMVVYRDLYGIELPDWQTPDVADVKATRNIIKEFTERGEYTSLTVPENGCFIFCYRTRAAHHVGLYYNGGVVHCRSGSGVVYEPIERFKQSYTKNTFGRWTP